MLDQHASRFAELSRFLKDRRARLTPESAKVAPLRRRRTSGLRREEVAEAAGISTAWYIRLEQGRDVRASLHALDRIGQALKLSKPEQAYLLQLARPDLDWKRRVRNHEIPSPGLLALLEGLSPNPAYILNRYWQVKACNAPARHLLGDLDNETKWGANLVARLFQDEQMRERFVEWPSVARSVVAQLRLATAGMANDPVMEGFIAQLCAANGEFQQLWQMGELAEPPIWQKAIFHQKVGTMLFDFGGLRASGVDEGFTVAVHTPADEATRRRLSDLVSLEQAQAG